MNYLYTEDPNRLVNMLQSLDMFSKSGQSCLETKQNLYYIQYSIHINLISYVSHVFGLQDTLIAPGPQGVLLVHGGHIQEFGEHVLDLAHVLNQAKVVS